MDSPSLHSELVGHANALRRLARDLVRDPHLAEDVVQDALCTAIAKPPRTLSVLPSWLKKVVARRASDLRRGEARRRAREGSSPGGGADARTDEQLELQQRVLAAVQALPEPYRTTVWQRYYDDRSPREIAALLGEPVKTVKTRLHRGLAKLRELLDTGHGSRRAWATLLAPFAMPATTLPGIVAMSATSRLAVAAAVVLLSASLWWVTDTGSPSPALPPEPGAITAVAANTEDPAPGDVRREPADLEGSGAAAAAAAPVQFQLHIDPMPPLSIGGVVIDLDARPVPGVEVAWNDAPFTPRIVTATDGTFRGERPRIMGRVGVVKEGLVPVLEPTLFDGTHAYDDLTIVVAPSVRLAGIVVDTAGAPIWSAQLSVSIGMPLRTRIPRVLDRCVEAKFETMTPDDGTFTILAAPCVATARLVIRAPGHRTLEVPVDEARHQDRFVMERVVAGDVLDGVVVDQDGAIVAQAVLVLHDHSVVTRPDGTFRIELWRIGDLPKGTLPVLEVASSHHLPGKARPLADDWRKRGAWPVPLRVQLGGAVQTIRGRVVRADGTPFAQPWVSFVPPEPEQIRPTVFDSLSSRMAVAAPAADAPNPENGEFETARVAPGRYPLRVFHPTTLEVFVTEPLATGPAPVEIRMPAAATWPPLRGVVVDRRGDPVPGADWLFERDDPTPGATEPFTGPWQHATPAGAIEHPPVSRAVRTLCVKAAGMAEWVRVDLASLPRVDDCRIVVPIGCQARIELGPNWPNVDRAQLLDGAGALSPVVFTNGNTATGTRRIALKEGRSQTFQALDDVTTLVLWRGEQEVARFPVVLRPGELNVLQY